MDLISFCTLFLQIAVKLDRSTVAYSKIKNLSVESQNIDGIDEDFVLSARDPGGE